MHCAQFGGGVVRRLIKYLVLVAPVVVEGFPNKGTPDQLRVAMLYLLREMTSLEPGLHNPGLAKTGHREE